MMPVLECAYVYDREMSENEESSRREAARELARRRWDAVSPEERSRQARERAVAYWDAASEHTRKKKARQLTAGRKKKREDGKIPIDMRIPID